MQGYRHRCWSRKRTIYNKKLNMTLDINEESLKYHSSFPQGKIKIDSSKPCKTQHDLTLSYTPGVAAPCLEIAKNPQDVWKYTNRGNTVAIVTDGTAVLGLGDIGPAAGLPVMEGKAVLFKKFADIDAYPLCYDFPEKSLDDFVVAVKALEPCMGGINLEDIAAPFCFELQEKLDGEMSIPVFHDDQDGTAIIIIGGLLNALKVVGKDISKIKIVLNGAGAAGIAIARLLLEFGVTKPQLHLCDSKGLLATERTDLNPQKLEFATPGKMLTLAEIIKDADVFIGVSVANVLKPEMVESMNKDAVIFAVSNPTPEIMPDLAYGAGARIVATGRSDFANQVNNSLGFPGIFRGALDTRASTVNKEMKIAASEALASLLHEPVIGKAKEILENAYSSEKEIFSLKNPLSEKYIIPKQFDLRVVPRVAKTVAKAAMDSGVANVKIENLDDYEKQVFERIVKNWI